MKCYSIDLINKKRNWSISYLANSFSVDDDRILRIKSRECGNLAVQIDDDEELTVNEIELEDIY